MKGKNRFTKKEIDKLIELIKERVKSNRKKQKKIRDKMRKIGFYGRDRFGIVNLQLEDFRNLIADNKIIITR